MIEIYQTELDGKNYIKGSSPFHNIQLKLTQCARDLELYASEFKEYMRSSIWLYISNTTVFLFYLMFSSSCFVFCYV